LRLFFGREEAIEEFLDAPVDERNGVAVPGENGFQRAELRMHLRISAAERVGTVKHPID
jgi:hypothetical protein